MLFDIIVIGAGAAGLFFAQTIAKTGANVLVIEKANKVGKKILMSGGGRCNFTNLNIEFDKYLSKNPHFCKSALSRYTQWDFIKLIEEHNIGCYEKKLGQLFCQGKSKEIVDMLLIECNKNKVKIITQQDIKTINHKNHQFEISTQQSTYYTKKCVIATGGLSIPTLGGSPFGYQIAKQFGHSLIPTKAGLVPLTYHQEDKIKMAELSGISIEASVSVNQITFDDDLLFTHRGLSGPAILQISSYWQPGESLSINLLKNIDYISLLNKESNNGSPKKLKTWLSQFIAKRLLDKIVPDSLLEKSIMKLSKQDLTNLSEIIGNWSLLPNGSEGYRTAEVTLGGVNVDEICSKTFESKYQKNLYFIGEVLDVSGWLGGYNFQWAWSSAYACAKEMGCNKL